MSDGQVGQRPFEMGTLAMMRLMDLAQGKKIQDPEYTGLDVCTKENAATYVKAGPVPIGPGRRPRLIEKAARRA